MTGPTPRPGVAPIDTVPARPGWWDYVTLTKPGITGLIVFVAVAGYFLAAPSPISWTRFAILLGTGALASAGAAMLNHYLDRDIDAVMRRTRGRPLPTERIVRSGGVAVAGLAFSALGIGLAAWALNPLTGVSILLGSLTYVVVYTIWLKRRSSWNIVIGGFAGQRAGPCRVGRRGGPLDPGGPRVRPPCVPLDTAPLLEPCPPAPVGLPEGRAPDAAPDG